MDKVEHDRITRELQEAAERANPSEVSVNAVVAYNLARIRENKGMTQRQVAERLTPLLGQKWSVQRYSTVERAYKSEVRRDISVNEVVAFARVFGVPVVQFFKRPPRALGIHTGAVGKAERFEGDRLARIVGTESRLSPYDLAERLRTLAGEVERE